MLEMIRNTVKQTVVSRRQVLCGVGALVLASTSLDAGVSVTRGWGTGTWGTGTWGDIGGRR